MFSIFKMSEEHSNYPGEKRPGTNGWFTGSNQKAFDKGSVAKAEAAREVELAKADNQRANKEALLNCEKKLDSLLGKLFEDPNIPAILSKILQNLNAEMSNILKDTKISQQVMKTITEYNSKNTDVSVVTVKSLVVSIMKSVQRDEILIILNNMNDCYQLLHSQILFVKLYYVLMGQIMFYLVKGLNYAKTLAFLKKKIKENKDYNFGMLEVVEGYLVHDHINLYQRIKCALLANDMKFKSIYV